jgi:hypothetical protein
MVLNLKEYCVPKKMFWQAKPFWELGEKNQFFELIGEITQLG